METTRHEPGGGNVGAATPRAGGAGRGQRVTPAAGRELLAALVNREHLETAVPEAIESVGLDPLIMVGSFPGDLLRALMEVPDEFWSRDPKLYQQYRAAVRAGAQARLQLPAESRLAFWSPLEL
jgi:hypothetical protein